jgi:L-ascorbate metabolism protein UlaG (beta-lactamase superfamily)
MKVRWLGWAGVEIEAQGAAVVIDPLGEPAATFAALGSGEVELPTVTAPAARAAVAGLVSHLHRDHADAGALAAALAPEGTVHEPNWPGGEAAENLALAQASAELQQAGLGRRQVEPWERIEVGPFAITALPAVDGLGDPQLSWLVEAEGCRVLHLGDTIFHGYWWRMSRRHGPFDVVFAPVNGPVIDFPHLQPPSALAAAMEPEQAALAGDLLRARVVVPMHYDGFGANPWYRPIGDAADRFRAAAAGRSFAARVLTPGESLELGSPQPAASA